MFGLKFLHANNFHSIYKYSAHVDDIEVARAAQNVSHDVTKDSSTAEINQTATSNKMDFSLDEEPRFAFCVCPSDIRQEIIDRAMMTGDSDLMIFSRSGLSK